MVKDQPWMSPRIEDKSPQPHPNSVKIKYWYEMEKDYLQIIPSYKYTLVIGGRQYVRNMFSMMSKVFLTLG